MKFLVFAALLFSVMTVKAHPVIYKGGTVIYTENSADMNDWSMSYSYHPQLAVGAHYIKEGAVELQFVQQAFLLKRWLFSDSQANIYTTLGAGAERKKKSWTSAEMGEVMADWEDRDYYVLGMQRWIGRHSNADDPNKIDLWHTKLRAGLAPFRSDTQDLGVWWIVQFDKHNDQNWTTTNLMRFYYKNVLWEVGANLNGSYQLNLMVHL